MGLVQLLKQWLGFRDGAGGDSARACQGGEGLTARAP